MKQKTTTEHLRRKRSTRKVSTPRVEAPSPSVPLEPLLAYRKRFEGTSEQNRDLACDLDE
jgi:hypothetical protein